VSDTNTLTVDQATTDAAGQQNSADAGTTATTQATDTQSTAAATTTQATDKTADTTSTTEPADFEITLPEGETLDEAAIAEIKAQAKELGLDKAKADKLAAAHVKQQKAFVEAQQAMFQKSVTKWAEDARADKEIGGDAFDANLATAKKALDTFATDGLKEMLKSTGFGNHPEVIRLFNRIGAAISEDRLVTGKAPGAPADPAKRMFPSMN
jgi:hypothetical protein